MIEKKNKILEIKYIAMQIIYKKYPEWKQINMIRESITEYDIPSEYISAWDWIDNIRDQSNIMEAEINEMNDIDSVKNYKIEYNV